MKSTQTHRFDQTARAEIPRSSFDLSHGYKTCIDVDYLYPIFCEEVLPGDTWNVSAALFGRLATPIKPIMDNMFLETFFFFVPYRQVWPNWVKFNGEQVNPADSTDFTIPVLSDATAVVEGTLPDYFGIPIGVASILTKTSVLPFRAYNHIYNNWFRDENLIDSASVPLTDGPDTVSLYSLRRRRKKKDYFTGALPWPQKGPDVFLSLGDSAEIHYQGANSATVQLLAYDDSRSNWYRPDAATATLQSGATADPSATTGRLYADLATATGITINDLRESFQIQRLLERDARGGTRYPEILQAHFGVTDPMMLVHQRPEFLGGGSSMVNINPVQQTSGTAGAGAYTATPQGNLAAYGTVSANNHGFTKSFTEHGVIIGLVNVRADLTYQQGLRRFWSRQTRFDFYWPALSHLGEQAVLNKEIYAQGNAADEDVFGYQERYAEYRYIPSQITSIFRSAATASLDVWHLAQDFAALPALNQSFIESAVPIDRAVAVPSEPDFLLDVYFRIRAARPLPLYGTPGLIDHF